MLSKKTILQLHEIITAIAGLCSSRGLDCQQPSQRYKSSYKRGFSFIRRFLLEWLEMMKSRVAETTFSSYSSGIKESIIPYFIGLNLTLTDIEENPKYTQDYYQARSLPKGLSSTTVLRRHANIRKAIQHAYKLDLIRSNPADKIERPKPATFSILLQCR